MSPSVNGKFNVNIKGSTHIGTLGVARGPRCAYVSEPAASVAGPWTSEDREPRDLFVSGDAFIGRNVSDGENFTLSVRGVAEVRAHRTLDLSPAVSDADLTRGASVRYRRSPAASLLPVPTSGSAM